MTKMNSTLLIHCVVMAYRFQMIAELPSNENLVSHIVLIIVNIIICISTVLTNSLTIITFLKCSKLRKAISFVFVLALSISDFGVGIGGSSLYILMLLGMVTSLHNSCILFFLFRCLMTLVMTFSLLILTGMNCERYLSIFHPIFHRTKVTTQIIWKYVLFSCICTIVFSILSFLQPIPIILAVFLAISIFVYIAIFASRLFQRVHNQDNTQREKAICKPRKRFAQEIRLAKSCFIIVFCCILCYSPAVVVRIAETKENLNRIDFRIYRFWSITLMLFNSSLNSCIFFWKNRALRREAKKVFLRGK